MKRIIEPGLLVSLNTSVRGNTRYFKEVLEYPHLTAVGEERSKHETTKIITDPDEQKAADKVRDKCRSLIKSVCSQSEFGLLCPEEREDELIEVIEQARELANEFNAAAVYTHVKVSIFWGMVAQDDVRATREIAAEIRDLLQDMQSGLAELDVKKVRAICDKATQMGQMLSTDSKTNVDIAVRAARASCKRIVKAGEAVVKEIDRNTIRTIGMARTSFLDLDDDGEFEIAVPAVSNARVVEV